MKTVDILELINAVLVSYLRCPVVATGRPIQDSVIFDKLAVEEREKQFIKTSLNMLYIKLIYI